MDAVSSLRERVPAFGAKLRTYVLTAWRRDRIFLTIVVLFDLFLARKTLGEGIWADNDSVCHYAYLRHLVEDFYPATGTFLGYSPKFDMGVPFLLYNTPPGTYVLSALVGAILHVSPLVALKLTVVAGFVSVPVLGHAITKTFDDLPEDAPKFVALTFACYSSELWGLEFFFKNGMLNPALGVPFLLATLYFFRRAQTSTSPVALRHLALAAFFFAWTVCTHLLSTYMLCLALGAFVLGRAPKEWGGDVLRLGAVLGLGGGLSAFWLVPSAPFAAKVDAAYTWQRRPLDTISSFFDGSLLASYFGGFFPSFITISNVGVVAIALGFMALIIGMFRRRETGSRTAFLVFALGFWIMLGPFVSFLIKWMPGYDRLLWYRFVTLAQLGWFMLAGVGAAYVAHLDARFMPYNRLALAGGFGWAIIIILGRAQKIETASRFPSFLADHNEVVAFLKEKGDRRGRVFDEFLGQAVIQPPSVNYPRHMTPILSGFDEVGGWVYENNLASQVLMRKGVFWNSPFPMIDQAATYNVKYIVAGSPHFVRALTLDPRWQSRVGLRNLVLFENVAYQPTLADGGGLVAKSWTQRYLNGGGYEYDLELARGEPELAASPLIVKVGYLPGFTVYADEKEVPHRPSADGLLEVQLPAGEAPKRLRCVWDITPLRTRGNRISYAALVVALALAAASYLKRLQALVVPERTLRFVGLAAGGLGVVGAAIRGRSVDLSEVGFGVRGGITSFVDPQTLKVGLYDDERATALLHVLPGAWEARATVGREPARRLVKAEAAVRVALAPRRAATLTLSGQPDGAPLHIVVEGPGGVPACEVEATMNAPAPLPPACAAEREGDAAGTLPGVTRELKIRAEDRVDVSRIALAAGIRIVEAESLRNSYEDSGYEAFYSFGAVESPPSNAVMMLTDVKLDQPVDLVGSLQGIEGRFDVWLLHRTFHPRFYNTRAEISVWIDAVRVGDARGEPRTVRDFWERDAVFEWVRLGEAEIRARSRVKIHIAKVEGAVAGLAEVDSLAFVPR